MAKLPRKLLKIFGSGAGATGITEYGSPASGSPLYSTDLDDIQTAAWGGGWSSAALAGTEIPTFQDFNAIHYAQTKSIKYLFQEGIPEYLSTETYFENSIVKKTGTYEIYGSKTDDNVGNALPSQTDNTDWEYLGDLSNIGSQDTLHIQEKYTSGTDGATWTSGSFQTRVLNTVVQNDISGSSLASNQVTLPAGTYYIDFSGVGDVGGAATVTHKTRIYDDTNSAILLNGFGSTAGYTSGTSQSQNLIARGFVTLVGETDIEIQHYTSTTKKLGLAASQGEELYADLIIKKIG